MCASKFRIHQRFTGNLHVAVFSTYKTGIMTTLNDFTTCCAGTRTGWCCKKKVCFAFSLVHNSFSRNLNYSAYAKF